MSARPLTYTLLLCCVACVSYERDDASPESIAADVAMRHGGAFSIQEAIDLALRQNPALRAAEASARAAGAATVVPITILGQWRGRNKSIEAAIDPIALLGLGPRGAAIDAAHSRQSAAIAQLAEARWRTIAAVTEEFLIDAALRKLDVADVQLNIDAYVQAGLASAVAAQQLRGAQARAKSEQIELRRAQHDSLARLRALLGLPAHAELTTQPIEDDWLQQPEGTDSELLARPDIALAAARFEVADAEFRQAVAEQYPSLQLGPNVSLMGDPMRAMGMFLIPIGMHGLAEAARERREAARANLEVAFLQARREASLNEEQLAATTAVATATSASLQASSTAFRAARTAIEVEVDAFTQLAASATMIMRDTMEHRLAAVAAARATVQRAVAYGWPRASYSENLQ